MAIRSDELRFHNACVQEIGAETYGAGEQLAGEIKPLLGADSIACVLMADGLTLNLDPFIKAFEESLRLERFLPLFGGLAADNWTAKKNLPISR